jgi:hypothetical protein
MHISVPEKQTQEGLSAYLVQPTVNHGEGSAMIWGCMLWEGPGYATRTEGTIDAPLFMSILEDELQQSLEYYGKEVEEVILHNNNIPKK